MVMKYPLKTSVTKLLGRCFHHRRFVQSICEAVADLSTVTVQEIIGKKLVNDDNGLGMNRETICGVQYRAKNDEICIVNAVQIICGGIYSSLESTL